MIEGLVYNKISYLYFLISYLIGSIPIGYILFKYVKNDDIRKYGSGNIGATNVNRLLGKKLGFLTLFFDVVKTALIASLAYNFLGIDYGIYCGALSIVGHIFPVWLGFKGGKGVASYIGLLAIVSWPLVLVFLMVWLSIVKFLKYSALGAIISIVLNILLFKIMLYVQFYHNLFLFIPGNPLEFNVMLIISFIVLIKHKENIKKIINKKI